MRPSAMNILITGVGGQGTVLLSRLIGDAAIRRGFNLRGSETIGMAQRGGSVVSHLRLSRGTIHSPLIPPGKADLIIAFEPAEAVRVFPFLAAGGGMIVLDRPVPPVTGSYDPLEMIAFLEGQGERLLVVKGAELLEQCGKAINTALLGLASAKKLLPFDREDIAAAMEERIPEKFLALNRRAFEAGEGLAS